MPDFGKMTVAALRKLARKIVGKRQSLLRTKAELVEALAAAQKKVAKAAGKAIVRGRTATAGAAAEKKAGKRAEAVAKKARAAGESKGRARAAEHGRRTAKRTAPPEVLRSEPSEAGLDPDGYFVARVRGEEAARQAPHHMTEGTADERAPASPPPATVSLERKEPDELPWSYEDDALVLLPRDPRTLFLYWDHAPATVARDFAGLDEARAQIWLFARSGLGVFERVRTVDFALEARCYYLHDLEPGRVYRAEVHLVDRAGRERMLGHPSNDMGLPAAGPSPFVADRVAHIPWDLPLQRWVHESRPAGPFSEEARALLFRVPDRTSSPGPWGSGA